MGQGPQNPGPKHLSGVIEADLAPRGPQANRGDSQGAWQW